jgi:hypothetical protein
VIDTSENRRLMAALETLLLPLALLAVIAGALVLWLSRNSTATEIRVLALAAIVLGAASFIRAAVSLLRDWRGRGERLTK